MKKHVISLICLCALSSMLIGADQTQKEPRVAGIASVYKGIVCLNVSLGQKVKKGDLLFSLKPDINNAKLEWYAKDFKTMEPLMKGAEKLIRTTSITRDTYEQAKHSYNDILIDDKLLRSIMTYSKYYAPFDGTVTKIYRYDGSGLGDNDDEVVITEGDVKVDTAYRVAMVCTPPWDTVLDIKVAIGQKVNKGDLLFTLKNIDTLKIQLEKDRNNLEKAQLKYERLSKLYDLNSTSLVNKLLAEFDVNRIQADVKIDEIKIADSSFYAPFDGTVTKIYRCEGSGIGQGKPVVDITASN